MHRLWLVEVEGLASAEQNGGS